MEETLTVHRLRVPSQLRPTLASTNVIESAFSIVETVHCCPVKCRIESIVYRDRVSHCRSRMRKVPVKWAFSRKE